MKLIAALIVLLAILAGILGPQAFFVVDETQLAVLTRFGEPRKSLSKPGLYVKTPFVEKVTYFDSRLLLFDAPPDRFLTKDKKGLIIDVYARGRIVDPLLFFRRVGNEAQAASRVVDIVRSELLREIALDDQSEIIKTNREDIMNKVRDAVQVVLQDPDEGFGIQIVDVRIKRADFPGEIAQSVYERMKAERQRKADRERSEGKERDLEVRADVDKQATIIRATAQRDADIIRGCGEAEAVKIFAEALGQDTEFYTFQRSLQAYRTYLTQNTTVVMAVDDFGKLFDGIRRGVVEGAAPPDAAGVDTVAVLTSRCAEVAAFQFLARELRADLLELELVSVESGEWTDTSLGCPEEDRFYTKTTVSGYAVGVDYQGTKYEVHSNQHGSLVVSCP